MRTNCVNCGAPVQLNQCACPWCNTPYRSEEHYKLTLDSKALAYQLERERLYQEALDAMRKYRYNFVG